MPAAASHERAAASLSLHLIALQATDSERQR